VDDDHRVAVQDEGSQRRESRFGPFKQPAWDGTTVPTPDIDESRMPTPKGPRA
jgi:hypothetical protein